MKNFFIRITLLFFSFLIISFFLYLIFYPLYTSSSVIFTFAITPFDIAKVYPKIWTFIKNSYFPLMFISYLIIFNYFYSNCQKYFQFKQASKIEQIDKKDNFNSNELKLLIGKNHKRWRYFFKWSCSLSKSSYYWYHRNSEKLLLLCILLLVN